MGVARGCTIKAGSFTARTSFHAVKMDDFKLIIGMDFLRDALFAIYPYGNSLIVLGSNPCMIPATAGKSNEKRLSAQQFKKGLKHKEVSYLAHPCWDEIEEKSGPVDPSVKRLLEEFEDVMPDELPKRLPPARDVDHEIELVPGTKPPARAPYRMSQPELAELRKQLTEMLEGGIIVPAKSPFGAPVLYFRTAGVPYSNSGD